MFAVGQASITKPPELPHPVEPLTSVDGDITNAIEVVTPVIVTVTAEALHEFALIAVVALVNVVSETPKAATAFVPGDVPLILLTVIASDPPELVTSPVCAGSAAAGSVVVGVQVLAVLPNTQI